MTDLDPVVYRKAVDILRPAVYRKAVDILRTDGWAQNDYETPSGRHCLIGAIRVACGVHAQVGSSSVDEPWLQPLADLLGYDEYSGVAYWNDQPDRTASDVILLLEQAAEKAEADR